MLPALLRGKLSRDQENMEDVLTSNVFGLLQYVSPAEGLFRWLALAEAVGPDAEAERFPLRFLAESAEVTLLSERYEFWPFWSQPDCTACEPDVVIRITDSHDSRWIILIEAKYRSGKSSEAAEAEAPPNDQLAREWDNLVRIAEDEGATPYLVYLTANIGLPTAEIEASIADFQENTTHDPQRPRILALSWRQIGEAFRTSGNSILRDLIQLHERLGLTYFRGVHCCRSPESWSWTFDRLPGRWTSLNALPAIDWRFAP